MLRACLSNFLTVAILANHLAAIPHSHDYSIDATAHSQFRPHFHLSWLQASGAKQSLERPAFKRHDPTLLLRNGLSVDPIDSSHDSDAVYLIDLSTAVNRAPPRLVEYKVPPCPIEVAASARHSLCRLSQLQCQNSDVAEPASSGIYLRLRCLRI